MFMVPIAPKLIENQIMARRFSLIALFQSISMFVGIRIYWRGFPEAVKPCVVRILTTACSAQRA